MKILLYGRFAEAIGAEIELDVEGACSIAELRRMLSIAHPQLAGPLASRRARACVGAAVVGDDHVASGSDVVEFLPPLSGG